jgi:hypothetical protein
MIVRGVRKGKSFTYNSKNKGKVWVSPTEAFEKTIKETKAAVKSTKGWMM